ncbi:MAG: cytochrome C oxidase subunit IV family protein, partial [Planctomycetota bacterium]
SSHEAHGVGHIVPVRYLVATGLALLVLTVVTVWIAQFHFGAANIFVALAIAVLKASLVVLFFMHLRWDRPFNSFIFIASIAFVALFIAFALTDTIEYRGDLAGGDAPAVETKINELLSE